MYVCSIPWVKKRGFPGLVRIDKLPLTCGVVIRNSTLRAVAVIFWRRRVDGHKHIALKNNFPFNPSWALAEEMPPPAAMVQEIAAKLPEDHRDGAGAAVVRNRRG